MKNHTLVEIKRGEFAADLQYVRAMLSAISACLHKNDHDNEVERFIDNAMKRLVDVRFELSNRKKNKKKKGL